MQARPGKLRRGEAATGTAGMAGHGEARQGTATQARLFRARLVPARRDNARPPSGNANGGFQRQGPCCNTGQGAQRSAIPMDGNSVGDNRLMRAIQTGVPVPGTPEQAAELVAMEMHFAFRMATDIVRCPECSKLGPRDIESVYATDGVCVKCGREMEKRDRNREYMSDGREGRDSFDRYCNEGDDE